MRSIIHGGWGQSSTAGNRADERSSIGSVAEADNQLPRRPPQQGGDEALHFTALSAFSEDKSPIEK